MFLEVSHFRLIVFCMASYFVSENYLSGAIAFGLTKSPGVIGEYISAETVNCIQIHNFGSLISIRKNSLDPFSLEQGFRVTQAGRTSNNAKWICSFHKCNFFVRANKRKDGTVVISSMDLTHNHCLFHETSTRPHPAVSRELVLISVTTYIV